MDGITEHGQFVGRAWQIRFINLTLTFKSLWQMGIVKNRQTVWRDIDDALNRIAHAIHRLVRQPINQVNIDRMKPKSASFRHHASNHFFRLHAIDGNLYFFLQILHTKAHPIKPKSTQYLKRGRAQFAWVNFNRIISGRFITKSKLGLQKVPQFDQFIIGQKGRCAAAKMHLLDNRVPLHQAAFMPNFGKKIR